MKFELSVYAYRSEERGERGLEEQMNRNGGICTVTDADTARHHVGPQKE